MKKFLKTIYYLFVRLLPSRGAVILMYHSIGDNKEFFTVKTEEFKKQMRYLRNGNFNVIKLSELVNLLQARKKIPSKTVVITIDDGYQDNFTNIFPVLIKYNMPASIFLRTDLIGSQRVGRNGDILKFLDWPQIVEMSKSLIDFYPHSHGHLKLAEIPLSEAENDISQSREILEEKLREETPIFAYPYGNFNDAVKGILKKLGFIGAVSVRFGNVKPGDDIFELKRNSIDSKISFSMFKGIIHFGRF